MTGRLLKLSGRGSRSGDSRVGEGGTALNRLRLRKPSYHTEFATCRGRGLPALGIHEGSQAAGGIDGDRGSPPGDAAAQEEA